jgi:hypothetical protein
MNFDPRKLFIGLMDFFCIILLGALLPDRLSGEVCPDVLGDWYAALVGAEAGAALRFASYRVGRLGFLLGSWLDELYEWSRRYAQHA